MDMMLYLLRLQFKSVRLYSEMIAGNIEENSKGKIAGVLQRKCSTH